MANAFENLGVNLVDKDLANSLNTAKEKNEALPTDERQWKIALTRHHTASLVAENSFFEELSVRTK